MLHAICRQLVGDPTAMLELVRLARAVSSLPSAAVGSKGDSFDNAVAATVRPLQGLGYVLESVISPPSRLDGGAFLRLIAYE